MISQDHEIYLHWDHNNYHGWLPIANAILVPFKNSLNLDINILHCVGVVS